MPDGEQRAAELLARLLTDGELRARFRSDPAAVCAEYDLPELGGELLQKGKALETLEIRESRSSLAGALLAAAGEGAHVVESMHRLHEQGAFTGDAGRAVQRALTNTRLRAVPHHLQDHQHVPRPVEHAPARPASPGTVRLDAVHKPDAAQEHVDDPVSAAPEASAALPDPTDAYPGDNAPPEALAAWMARQAHGAGLPGELPVMAALTESGLQNLQHGDADSLGFFQMRVSVWDHGEYAGFAQHPELQLKWFIDNAVAVRQRHLSAGDSTFGSDRDSWGDWVADVENPAAQYRGRYQLHLDRAHELLAGADPAAADPAAAGPAEGAVEPDGSGVGDVRALAAISIARKYLGTPYHWGGESPETGFDCSGIAQYAYGQAGVELPRVAADQFHIGLAVSRDDLEPGDLVFFQDSTGYIHHVGIYVGNDMFLHAPHTGDVVKISSLDTPYYAHQLAGGRRVSELADPDAALPPVGLAGAGPASESASTARSGVFDALGAADARARAVPRSTVQFLPAVPGPSTGEPADPAAAEPVGTDPDSAAQTGTDPAADAAGTQDA